MQKIGQKSQKLSEISRFENFEKLKVKELGGKDGKLNDG